MQFLKKNLNASRPSEHPPVRGEIVKTFKVGSYAANTKNCTCFLVHRKAWLQEPRPPNRHQTAPAPVPPPELPRCPPRWRRAATKVACDGSSNGGEANDLRGERKTRALSFSVDIYVQIVTHTKYL